MEALRREFKKTSAMTVKKVIRDTVPPCMEIKVNPEKEKLISDIMINNKKMIVDKTRLDNTIENAKKVYTNITKKPIVFLDEAPTVLLPSSEKPVHEIFSICKAMNLNGTPCKCRAKIGKFCAKHAC